LKQKHERSMEQKHIIIWNAWEIQKTKSMYLFRNPKRKNTPKEPNIKKQKHIPLQAFLPLLLSPTPSNFLWTSRTSSPILSVLLPSLFPSPLSLSFPPFLPFFLPQVLIQFCFFFHVPISVLFSLFHVPTHFRFLSHVPTH